MSEPYSEKYLEGIRLFNEEEFFECHDELELLWSETIGEEKKYLQGLIQASVALFHFGNENYGGARKLFISSLEKLDPYGEHYMGVNLGKFTTDFRACFAELMQVTSGYPVGIELRDELVPRIEFDPE